MRDMMAALIAGERKPQVLAQMARARMRTTIPQLEEAFAGHFTDHHRFLLTRCWPASTGSRADIADLDSQIEARSPLSLTRLPAWMRSPGSVPPRPR